MQSRRSPSAFSLIATHAAVVLAFAVIGALSTQRSAGLASGIGLALFGIAFGILAPLGLSGALILLFPKVVRTRGWDAVVAGALRSFLLMIPYAVLAVIAQLVLHWNATGAFAAAGLMTACTAVGAEVGRLGGSKLTSMLLPMLVGSALSTTWLGATSLLTMLITGGLS